MTSTQNFYVILAIIFAILFIILLYILVDKLIYDEPKKSIEEIPEDLKNSEWIVKFYFKNGSDVSIEDISYEDVLKIKESFSEINSSTKIVNQNFITNEIRFKAQINLNDVHYIEYRVKI